MDKPALVQEELKDDPDDEKYGANYPHFEFPLMTVGAGPHACAATAFVREQRRDCRAAGNKKTHWR